MFLLLIKFPSSTGLLDHVQEETLVGKLQSSAVEQQTKKHQAQHEG